MKQGVTSFGTQWSAGGPETTNIVVYGGTTLLVVAMRCGGCGGGRSGRQRHPICD